MSAPKNQHPLNRLKSHFQNICPAASVCSVPNVHKHRRATRIEQIGSDTDPVVVLSGVRDEHGVLCMLYGQGLTPVRSPGSVFRYQEHSSRRQ